MGPLLFAAIISTLHLEGDVTAGNGDYVVVPFTVPAGTVELEIDRTTTPAASTILDFGVWDQASAWRGWSGGLTDPIFVGVADSSRGYVPGAIAAGDWQLVIGKAKLPGPAHYTADFTFRDAATLTPRARGSFAPSVVRAGPAWYAGDLHVHSNESGDATATFDQIIALARSRHLDFVVLSDHNTVSQQSLIPVVQASLTDLLLVRGIEVTTYEGHGGALGASAYVDHRIGLNGRTAAQMIADVNAQGGLFVVNHPELTLGTACIGCAWLEVDTPWMDVGAIEIQTGDYGTGIELFTGPSIALWDMQLDIGAKMAAVGGSDDHRAGMNEGSPPSLIGSPTTRVFADELSESAIVAAVRAGRTVVALRGPDDPTVELNTTGANPKMIGDTVSGDRVDFVAHVVGGSGEFLELVVNGASDPALRAPVDAADWTHTFTVQVPPAGGRVRAVLADATDEPIVVTSHVWLSFEKGASSSGCAMSGENSSSRSSVIFIIAALVVWISRRAGAGRTA